MYLSTLLETFMKLKRGENLNGIPYYKPFETPDAIYSVDMVRVAFDIGSHGQEFSNFLQQLDLKDALNNSLLDIQYYHSFLEFKYEHLWTISDKKSDVKATLSVGLHLRGGGANDGKSLGFLEFNPNKVMYSPVLKEIITEIQVLSVETELKRYDLAIDLPIPRNLAKLERVGKKMYQQVIKDDGITEYSGRRNTHGFVKLYDKTKESNLDRDFTRLEITLEPLKDAKQAFPVVRVNDAQYSLDMAYDLNDTERTLVALLRSNDDMNYYIKMLGRKMRKRIEPYLSDKVLTPDNKALEYIRELALSFAP